MKLLLDENLSRRLVPLLQGDFPGSIHVSAVDMLRTPDPQIWDYAKANDFTIITKDDDFLAIAQRNGSPPKLIMVELGNCTNVELAARLKASAAELAEFASNTKAGIIKLV